jgi:hypothetical protein
VARQLLLVGFFKPREEFSACMDLGEVESVAMMAEASEKHLWAVFSSLRPADFTQLGARSPSEG